MARSDPTRPIRRRLAETYGVPRLPPHGHPIAELVLTVLSQSTNDRNRDVAYLRLRDRFPTWELVRGAPVDEIEAAIRPGGLSPTKSVRIQEILRALPTTPEGEPTLDDLPDMGVEQARALLTALPGVGRKTAACVLLFSFGMPDVPVDTHVYRVGTRLGIFRPKASFDEAHDEFLRLVDGDADEAYEIHVALIRHGRRICHARNPLCEQCPLLELCPYGQARVRSSAA